MKRYILKERLSYEPTGHSSSFNSARGDALGKETGDCFVVDDRTLHQHQIVKLQLI